MEGINDSVGKTIDEIKAIEGEVAVMGGNDYEIPALEDLINNLKSGKLSSEEAVKQATKIRDTKQNYH